MTTSNSLALLPQILSKLFPNSLLATIMAAFTGSLWLAMTAQLSIPLSFTPVPITGQTFGVAVLALLWGRKQATASMALYLIEGAVGLPVFAQGKAFLSFGPTAGYLIGMLMATWLVGGLADKGFAKTFKGALASVYVGSFVIFLGGALGLSLFVPTEKVLALGVLPFLIGDFVKNTLAAGFASSSHHLTKK